MPASPGLLPRLTLVPVPQLAPAAGTIAKAQTMGLSPLETTEAMVVATAAAVRGLTARRHPGHRPGTMTGADLVPATLWTSQEPEAAHKSCSCWDPQVVGVVTVCLDETLAAVRSRHEREHKFVCGGINQSTTHASLHNPRVTRKQRRHRHPLAWQRLQVTEAMGVCVAVV